MLIGAITGLIGAMAGAAVRLFPNFRFASWAFSKGDVSDIPAVNARWLHMTSPIDMNATPIRRRAAGSCIP